MAMQCVDDDGLFSSLHLGGDVKKTRLVVVPQVEDNGCHKIKVAVLLQRVTPSPTSRTLSGASAAGGPADDAIPAAPLGGGFWGAPAFLVV